MTETQTPPLPPPPAPRLYHPRAFGFEVGDSFIEGTLWSEPSSPHLLNAEGRYSPIPEDGAEGEDTWTDYESLVALGAALSWDQAAMQSFIDRLRAILATPVRMQDPPVSI